MMSSRVLSRLLPVAEGDVSVFESMRPDAHRNLDLESQRGTSAGEPFHDYEEDPDRLLFEGTHDGGNERTSASPASPPSTLASPNLHRGRPKWLDDQSTRRIEEDEDVPESLLLEPRAKGSAKAHAQGSRQAREEAQWKAAQQQHGLHAASPSRRGARGPGSSRPTTAAGPVHQTTPQADAMWLYTNANNLDAFLLEVYQYYVQHGVWSILLARAISLLTELFVFSFAMFLTTCIDYSLVSKSNSTAEIMIPKCMSNASWLKNAALYAFVMYWLIQSTRHLKDIRRLFRMRDFYLHILGINDVDLQTVSWVRVVDGLVKVQDANVGTANQPSKARAYLNYHGYRQPQQRLNAESIANRLMRQDNYYVAMYNKDILDFTLPLPFVGSRQFYSKSLEWCIDFCLTNFIFDEQGSIRPFCLEVRNRKAVIDNMRTRLRFAAITSVVLAPFNILRFCVIYFFRYYTDFTRNPSRASARSFTPFAEWKIRQFNELDHLFQRRLRQAHPFADEYLKQFPKDKTDQLCRFVAFISGAIAAILTIATLLDHELFLGFEVTPGRTAVFWLTIMVGVFGFAHGMLPDENEVHDPVLHLKQVLYFMEYMPAHWKDRLHSNEVRSEFSALYQMKILIFFEEILSLIVAPWILLRNAHFRSERIIDFFREQTVHVDGIGNQCNHAVFGFKKDLGAEDPTALLNQPDGLRDDYFGLKDDKMASSVQNFMQYYSHYNRKQKPRLPRGWQPPPAWPSMTSPGIPEETAPSASAARLPAKGTAQEARQRPANTHRSPRNRTQPQALPMESLRPTTQGNRGMSESRLMSQDSDLNDYADAPGKDKEVLESDTDEGEKVPGEGAGVLGMLYQFSKAQAEKGTGVNI